jgi:acetyl-CoA acetyltransferase
MAGPNRGSVAIVGIAESDIGQVAAGMTPADLMAQAVDRALDDCGLGLRDVDGVFAAATQMNMPVLNLCEYLRIQPRYMDGTHIGGASFLSHVAHAQAAIEAGACRVAVVAYGSTQRTSGRATAAPQELSAYEAPYRPVHPVTAYALAASRHMYEFGTTREQLAAVAVAARQWAQMNERAWEKKPLSIADVLASPVVASPLTVRDCCLVTDGGGALVIVAAAEAARLKKKPAYVLGTGESTTHRHVSEMPDLTVTAARESGKRAFSMARVSPRDVDVAQIYDAFTINTILFLEDLGFCPKGEGGRFVEGGRIAPGGELPVNTNGGGLSYCHPGMYGIFALIEAVRQIRGESGARNVSDCDIALAHGNGGVLSSQASVVLGSPATV